MCGLNNPIAFTEQYFSYTSLQTSFHCLILISAKYGGDEDQEHAEKACVSGLLVSWTICICFYCCWPLVCDEYFRSCGNNTHTEELVAYGERGSVGGALPQKTHRTQNKLPK